MATGTTTETTTQADEPCVVCYENYTSKYQPLNCKHHICDTCYDGLTTENNYNAKLCPCCRATIGERKLERKRVEGDMVRKISELTINSILQMLKYKYDEQYAGCQGRKNTARERELLYQEIIALLCDFNKRIPLLYAECAKGMIHPTNPEYQVYLVYDRCVKSLAHDTYRDSREEILIRRCIESMYPGYSGATSYTSRPQYITLHWLGSLV